MCTVWPALGDCHDMSTEQESQAASAGSRIEERSDASTSPGGTSWTSSKPLVITVMFDSTTSSPNRPNFFSYWFFTISRKRACETS